MKLKNILKLAIISTLAITSFTACGGGGGGSDASFGNTDTQNQIDISIECITDRTPTIDEIDDYITLKSGDTIVKTTTDTTISTYHDTDGVKKVCLIEGSAYILR